MVSAWQHSIQQVSTSGIKGGVLIYGAQSEAEIYETVRAVASTGSGYREIFVFPGPNLDISSVGLDDLPIDSRLVRFSRAATLQALKSTQTLALSCINVCIEDDWNADALAPMLERLAKGGMVVSPKTVEHQIEFSSINLTHTQPIKLAGGGYAIVKLTDPENVEIERYDYVSPRLEKIDLLEVFPSAIASDPWPVQWPYLRKHIPHIWRTDERNTGYVTGYASVDEATFLYNIAKQFEGKRALEIGTHYGWTAAHLLAAGVDLDCADPAFLDGEHENSVRRALGRAIGAAGAGTGTYRLWAGYCPDLIPEMRRANDGSKWSLAFIDGDHDGDAPLHDAQGVLPNLADDAVVVFHDLVSPHVEKGLDFFDRNGFQTAIIETAQILGVAHRGDVAIPPYEPDPNVGPTYVHHLQRYPRVGSGSRF